MNVYSNSNYFGFNITGFDRYLDRSLEITNEFITTMHADEKDKKKTKKLVQSSKLNRKTQKRTLPRLEGLSGTMLTGTNDLPI
ncbi:MAG: hypothetical protein Ct9H300mP9_5010 [Candidatus Neomarinimicrobiota bacterium]|nr:MAG: hypothetical protein Ct9H300mP9_5010 [Candidatus Neomarinimicrobiota bacterium]